MDNNQHIEVFVTETSEENNQGVFEITGYKKVNAITEIEEGNNYIKTDIQAIEDSYNNEGQYIKTEVVHSTFKKSSVTMQEDGGHSSQKIQGPSTILLPEQPPVPFQLDDMSEEEREQVKEHILAHIEELQEN